MYPKFYCLCLLVMHCILFQSCTPLEGEINQTIQKATFIDLGDKEQLQDIGFYDLNRTTNELEWRTIKPIEKKNDKAILTYTINTFFKQNKLLKEATVLKLIEIEERARKINIIIAGENYFQSTEEEEILKMALELTIARTMNTDQFNIIYELN